jgi:predicted dehydrogenase
LHSKTGTEEFVFDIVDQYTLEADAFAKAVLENTSVPTSLQDAINNMKVIEAIFESSKDGMWKKLG